MSDYRDDMNDTAVASDTIWTGIKTLAESTAFAAGVALFGIGFVVSESAVASDLVQDKARTVVVEHASASDQVLGAASLANLLVDGARARDAITGRTRVVTVESVGASDEIIDRSRAAVQESALGSDQVFAQRTARQDVAEQAAARDVLIGIARTLVQDDATVSDEVLHITRAVTLVSDAAAASDEVHGASATQHLAVSDVATASDAVLGVLHAFDLVTDGSSASGGIVQGAALHGQAWTAETGIWAMSRYAPFAFHGLAVVNGVVHACGPDGVFALDDDGETITAQVVTGAMDVTGGTLARPLEAHVEYELDGVAEFDVAQTQAGVRQSFTYPLSARPVAQELTNARAVFGRGLRGRHFAYTLRLTGTRAYINDWSVLVAASKRSI